MARQRSMEAILASESVTIGELVRLTGIRYSTLKFYTEEGFLPFRQEERGLTRRYPREESTELPGSNRCGQRAKPFRKLGGSCRKQERNNSVRAGCGVSLQ